MRDFAGRFILSSVDAYNCCTVFSVLWHWSRDSLLIKAPDSRSKSCEFESFRSSRRIFFSSVNFMCWFVRCSFHPHVIAVAHKRPGSFWQKCRWHLNMHSPLTQQGWCGLTMLLSRQSMGIYPEMSSHTTCQGTLSRSRLSLLSHCGLILA